MKIRTSYQILVICTTYLLTPSTACPSQCMCKWKNGKEYIECVDEGLKQIPEKIEPHTQILDFAGNDIQVLQKEIFLHLGLLDLQKIFLSRCKIHKIDNNAFKGLSNLVELDLSNNYITNVPSHNFIFFPSLMRLLLNNNPITTIKSNTFQHLSFLNTLELSECKIDQIENEGFSGLHHLEWLRLKGNKLTSIKGDNIFPDTLRGIDLESNPWNCDCHLRDLHRWLLHFKMTHTIGPTCTMPDRLKKRKITNIVQSDLACAPKMLPTSVYLETNEGNNITLECLAKAVPDADISWWFQGHTIHNNTRDDFYVRKVLSEIGSEEKKSELYLANIDKDNNGTYICVADNIAGRAIANYTIKVIHKEKPLVVVVPFTRKHLVAIVTGVFLIIILIIAIIAVVLLKFKTDTKSRKKIDSGKDVALNTEETRRGANQLISFDSLQRKCNGTHINNTQMHHVVHYTIQENNEESFKVGSKQNVVDRNPDLINDAAPVTTNNYEDTMNSVYNNQNCDDDIIIPENNMSFYPMPRQVTWRDQQNFFGNKPQNVCYNTYQLAADIHLNPGCFLDNEGYPPDYGLPKLSCRPAPVFSNYAVVSSGFQTLPHNRAKPQKLACKFAKDTEFNSPPCLKYATGNLRHTVEGYPLDQNPLLNFPGKGNLIMNQTNTMNFAPVCYQPEPITMCCSIPKAETCTSWAQPLPNPKGTCAVMVPMDMTEMGPGKCYHIETRCVDTQTPVTRTDNTDNVKTTLKNVNPKYGIEVYTESPDEGYVGEALDVSEA